MELKTKEGKYFTQLGSWGSLFSIIIFVLILKTLGMFAATIASMVALLGALLLTRRNVLIRTIKNLAARFMGLAHRVGLDVLYKISLIALISLAVYMLALRPVLVKKSCSVVSWREEAVTGEPQSDNWPECAMENPFNNLNSVNPRECHGPRPARQAADGVREARDKEYRTCLRDHGL